MTKQPAGNPRMDHMGHMGHMDHMDHAGHDHHGMMTRDLQRRFYITLAFTVPVMLLSDTIQHWLGIHLLFPGSGWLLLALSSFIFFYGGWPFLQGWYREMKPWNPGMMTLIGFAISVVAGFPMSVAWWSIIAGLMVSSGVGIFFGVYPARKAAMLDPITALRSD